MMTQGAEPVSWQEQELFCRAPCDVTGGSGSAQVGTDIQLMQVLVIP